MTLLFTKQANELTELDKLLLEVLVSAEPRAAWHTWRNAIDWDGPIGPAAFQLVPLIYKKLVSCGIDDPILARFKGIMRRNWVANQRRLAPVAKLAQAFTVSQVTYVLLPPLLTSVVDGMMKTQSNTMRIGIARSQAVGAVDVLLDQGWVPSVPIADNWLAGYLLRKGKLRGKVDGHPLEVFVNDQQYRVQKTYDLLGHKVALCDVTTSVHDFCVHLRQQPLMVQLAELLMLLSVYADGVDALRFAALCEGMALDNSAEKILTWGHQIRPNQIPANLFRQSAGPSPKSVSGTFWQRLQGHWHHYQEVTPTAGWRNVVTTLPGYLLADWNLTSPKQLPIRALKGLKSDWLNASSHK